MAGATPDPTPSSASPEALMREQRLQRNLKIVVIGLGALILIGLGSVIGRVIYLANHPKPAAPSTTLGAAAPGTTTTIMSAQGNQIAVEIPTGAHVVSVSLSGNRLALQHEGPTGTGVTIIDIDTGQRVADVKPLAAVPRN